MIKKIINFFDKAGLFSRAIVTFCIAYSVRVIEWSMDMYEQHPGLEPTTIITATTALFGGELLFLVLKRIFADKDKKNNTKKSSKVSPENDTPDSACG